MVGPFVNPLPIRNQVPVTGSALDLLRSEKRAVMEAFAHQDCPFAKIVEAVNPERTSNDNPLFNVGFVMENFPEIELKGRHFEAEYLNFDPEASLLDLRFVAIEKHGGLRLSCEYKSALFAPETVDALLHAYAAMLDAIASEPSKLVADFALPATLVQQSERSAAAGKQRVVVAATYTAEPIREPLEFWLKQLGMPTHIEFALFNQVFQQLLDPASLFATNEMGANVVLLRIEDLRGVEGPADDGSEQVVDAGVAELLAALRSGSPTSVCTDYRRDRSGLGVSAQRQDTGASNRTCRSQTHCCSARNCWYPGGFIFRVARSLPGNCLRRPVQLPGQPCAV